MSYQDYHGHSFEVSFRRISCGLQGMEVFQTMAQEASTPEYTMWHNENRERFETSHAELKRCIVYYNTLDYRWRRRECKVVEVRTGKVKYMPIFSRGTWDWAPDDFVYAEEFRYQRRLQRAIIALDGPLILADPTYRLQERMARAGIRRGHLQWDEFVHEDVIAQLEAHVTVAQWQFLRTHFPWLMD